MPKIPAANPDARLSARAAVDPDVAIVDFKYTPGSTTVRVGETVTWTNRGPSSHTATARDGSFDTGVLKPGTSASHGFTKPGTYTFYCQIHPFMHGTIVVLPAAAPTQTKTTSAPSLGSTAAGQSSSSLSSHPSSSGSAAGSSASTSSTPASRLPASPTQRSARPSSPSASTDAPSSAPAETLPRTGANLATGLLSGLLLLAVGVILRRRGSS